MHVRQGQEGKNDDKKDSQDVHPFFRGGGVHGFRLQHALCCFSMRRWNCCF